ALLALAALAKFAPLALAPLYLTGERGLLDRRRDRDQGGSPLGWLRPVLVPAAAALAVAALMLAHPAIDPGLATFWERTVQSQLERGSPFSIWGQAEGIGWLQTITIALAVGLAVAVAFVPRRRSIAQVAALAAAVLLAVQFTAEHWFYLYIPWFLPALFIGLAIAAPVREPRSE
ncbi:MAG: hypothetical protein ACRDLO_00345, partial [Solirubrobacterales bacterium]